MTHDNEEQSLREPPAYDFMIIRALEREFGPKTALGPRLARLVSQRWFLIATTLGFVAFLVWGALPWDHGIVDSTDIASSVLEKLFITYVVFSNLLMMFAATAHAVLNRVRVWRWLNFVVWPCSFFYVWRLYWSADSASESSGV